MPSAKFVNNQLPIFVGLFTVVFLIIFGIFGTYSREVAPAVPISDAAAVAAINRQAPLVHDTNAFVLIGFGFLVTFLRRYGYGALAINLMLVAFVLEWALIIRGFLSLNFRNFGVFPVGLRDIARADYTVATILVTYGALVGKLSPIQYLMVAFVETPIAILNEYLLINVLGIGDLGGSLTVHLFGAIFGVVASRMLFRKTWLNHDHEGSLYHSDIFSFIGTLFLWAFWPSFNSLFALTANEQQRAMLNTYMALIASTLTVFFVSPLLHPTRRLSIKHVASASLAGGVASAIVANHILTPWPALLLGIVAGAASVVSFGKINTINGRLNLHDTRGVFSLHAVPAIIGAVASVLLLIFNDMRVYGETARDIYPLIQTPRVDGRTAVGQALMQLLGLAITLLVAAIAGAITGAIARLSLWQQVREPELYADGDFFDTPNDYDTTTRVTVRHERVELAPR